MDPVRSRVREVHRTQREKFYSVKDPTWDKRVKQAQRVADLLCIGFVALAGWLAYLISTRSF